MHNRKKLANNEKVKSFGFGNELYIAESMCIENQQLFYRCRKAKALKKIHSCWFFNSCVIVKVRDQGLIIRSFLNIKPKIFN